MKLGLIADIHADFTALTIALTILQREKVDKILCAGDLVEKGGDGDAVIALMREHGIFCVRGNHDELAIENQRWMSQKSDTDPEANQWRTLQPETLAYLQKLPFALRFQIDGLRVLLVHGTPESNWDYLYPHVPHHKFKALANDAEADIVIGGHTHVPMSIKIQGVLFINPGAVCGKPNGGSHTCATLALPDGDLRVFGLNTGKQASYALRDYSQMLSREA
jgi:putative phosphoesterase